LGSTSLFNGSVDGFQLEAEREENVEEPGELVPRDAIGEEVQEVLRCQMCRHHVGDVGRVEGVVQLVDTVWLELLLELRR
jgi:hypothetical protein